MSSPAAQYLLRSASSAADWQAALLQIDPAPPLLQAWQWGDFKARHGWQPRRMLWDGNARAAAGAQLLQRSARTFGLNSVIQYVPHGPLLDWRNPALAQTVLADLRTAGKQANAIFIKIDPALALAAPSADASTAAAADLLTRGGWKLSASQIQFRNTVVLDLQQQPEKLLAAFKTKTRYNIRLAQRHGVNVQPATTQQLPALYEMYKQTAQRDGFPIRPQAYYLDLWSSFAQAGLAQPLIAEYGAQPIAGAVVFAYAQQAVYMHGMSSSAHRDKMPNYLLQWHALQWAHARGCTLYDMWGAPDNFETTDPLAGVWRFKSGFNGRVVRTPGAWDLVLRPAAYTLYEFALPRLLQFLRRTNSGAAPG